MRLLLIDDHPERLAALAARLELARPDAELVLRAPGASVALPPELTCIGFDAVLLAASAGSGCGRDWAAQLATRTDFPPVWLLAEEGGSAALMPSPAGAPVPAITLADVTGNEFGQALDGAARRQELARALWRSSEGGRATQRFGGVFIRGYRFLRRLAGGRSSELYLAEGERTPELLALKVARDRAIDGAGSHDPFRRFLQEYEIVERIQGPAVVRVHDLGVNDEHAWLVMEYCAGGDLRARLRAGIDTVAALELALGIARALVSVHQAGVLHRDLKPGNVMLRADGSVALIDFGLSKDAALALEMTDDGTIFGTPHYISPEQGHCEPVDARSDLYSLGVMLYEMLTGTKPFRADNPMAIIYLHRKAPVPRLPPALRALQPLLDRLLAKDPADRFADAAAAAAALADACSGHGERVSA